MKRILLAILLGVMVLPSTLTHAAQRPTKTGERAAKLARTALQTSVETIMADRRNKCMNAIGSPAFCDCLNGYLPMAADFQKYIVVTTTSRAEFGYEQLTRDDKEIADLIILTRDQCVAKVFATPK
jgi:hypothetical protein